VKEGLLVFTCSHAEVEAGKDHIAGTPEKLLKAADCGGMLIMLES